MFTLLDVDVNLPDDDGRTIVSHAAENPSLQSLNQINYLISKHADLNRADKNGCVIIC